MANPGLLGVLFGILLLAAAGPATAAGFQRAATTDAVGRPLELAIWYPSAAPPRPLQAGPFDLQVAPDAVIAGRGLPLILISHGAGGSELNHHDMAAALANAGFVVVAPRHAGDNYRDGRDTFTPRNFANRPRQVGRVIDHMLQIWPHHTAIDPSRIGILGYSAGGTTALIAAGGRADWSQVAAFCATHAENWGCSKARETFDAAEVPQRPAGVEAIVTERDPRLKAAVLAAPALAMAFRPVGLAAVGIPIQLWVSAEDRVVSNAADIRTLLPGEPDYHLVPKAGHFGYLAPCSEGLAALAPNLCSDPPGFDRAAFQPVFQDSVIAFFRDHLGTPR